MPHQFQTQDQRLWKASKPISLWRTDGTQVEGIWGGSAKVERLDWWLRKPGNELTQTDEVAAVAVRGEVSNEIRWGQTPSRARLLFVLEPPVQAKSGATYRIARMVTTAATPAQASYFEDERFALLGRIEEDGSIDQIAPLAPPEQGGLEQSELF